MIEIRSRLAAAVVTATVGLSLAAIAPANASGPQAAGATHRAAAAKKKTAKKKPAVKTVTACVNKKSGATKVLLGSKAKRKCAKGWTKMTWNVSGKNGANGKNGTNGTNGTNGANAAALAVRDAAGNRLGLFAGMLTLGAPLPIVQVLSDDGGLYLYLESGQVAPLGMLGSSGSMLFADSACAGPAYMATDAAQWDAFLSIFVGGSLRITYRATPGPSLLNMGPTRAWKLSNITSVVPAVEPDLYQLDNVGTCAPAAPSAVVPGELLVALEAVEAPRDGVGRLTIG